MTDTANKQRRRMTPAAALDHARNAHTAGAHSEAVSVARQLRSVDQNNIEALAVLAAASAAIGDFDAAVEANNAAVKLRPSNSMLHANLCEILRRAGDLDGAVAAGREAVSLSPSSAAALSNLGIALYERGDLDGAETYQRRALTVDASFARALNNLGSILRDNKDSEAALVFYQKAHAAAPQDEEILNNLGNVLVEANKENDAIRLLTSRVKRGNAQAETYAALGRAFLNLDKLDDAERCFRKALQMEADNTTTLIGLARTIQSKNHPKIALEIVQKALALEPEKPVVLHLHGSLLSDLNQPEQARDVFLKTLEIDPTFLPAILSLGYHYMEIGDKEKARAAFENAVKNDEKDFAGHLGIARLDKLTKDHPTLLRLEEKAKTVDEMPGRRAVSLHYALGKAYDDIKRHEASFQNYAKGAALKRGMIRHDPAIFTALVDRIIATFTREHLSKLRESAITSDRSIFVLGMPRSGTTLTETIIASHPDVHGGGELRDLHRLMPTEVGPVDKRFPHVMASQDTATIKLIMQDYDRAVSDLAGTHSRITDKMPANFVYLGVIHALLPNAQIVHTVRDPVDTCLSCFTRLFDRAQYHSYDQMELGTYYNNYRRLMEHWRSVLPKDAFMDLRYEDLVTDFENEARRLITWCNLDWNAACLTPHKTKRSVRTASVTQVREPIYTTSIQKWRVYEEQLQPLLKTLGSNATV